MTGIFLALTSAELQVYLDNSKLLKQLVTEHPPLFNIDRTWDALAYLVSEQKNDLPDITAGVLGWLISGDKPVDELQDLGCGPAHYLTPWQVKEVDKALNDLRLKDLRLSYDPVQMNELNIYPGFWDDEPGSFAFLETQFEKLRIFYSEAAANGKAVLMYIN